MKRNWEGVVLKVMGAKDFTLQVTARVTAPGDLHYGAQVETATEPDRDSTPSNDVPTEDDQASAAVDPIVADLAIVTAGAATTTIYPTMLDADVALDVVKAFTGTVRIDPLFAAIADDACKRLGQRPQGLERLLAAALLHHHQGDGGRCAGAQEHAL